MAPSQMLFLLDEIFSSVSSMSSHGNGKIFNINSILIYNNIVYMYMYIYIHTYIHTYIYSKHQKTNVNIQRML